MTIGEALNLHEDAAILLAHILSSSPPSPPWGRGIKGEGEIKSWLFANPDKRLSKLQATSYKLLIRKRANHWPVAYLVGHKEFFGLDFAVTPDVLIPRPETELLVELALQLTTYNLFTNIIDLGTGSGNIIVSIAKSLRAGRSNLNFFAIDSSAKALQVARLNARRHSVAKKIKFLRGNLLDPLLHLPLMRGRMSEGRSSLIIGNLPYLTPAQIHANPDLKHEPRAALLAGPDGLKYYREFFKQLSQLCAEDCAQCTVLIEFDPSQKSKIKGLVKFYFAGAKIKFHKDLAGHWRVAEIIISLNAPYRSDSAPISKGKSR